MMTDAASSLLTTMYQALDREAVHWLARMRKDDIVRVPLQCGGSQLVTRDGAVLSTVRIEADGYVIRVVVERRPDDPSESL